MVVVTCLQWCHNVDVCGSASVLASRFPAPELWVYLEAGSFQACGLTKRAPDKWESPRFTGSFRGLELVPSKWRCLVLPLAGNAHR